ncbi:pseudouridine synthase [Streptomyces sp. NBRC 110611]|nr:pseudouridine synthase [Streptomyces sp. NBRC 110611]
MREFRHGLGLAAEALAEGLLAAELGVQGLDRDVTVEHGVVREVHGRHAARPEKITKLVTSTADRTALELALSAVLAHRSASP